VKQQRQQQQRQQQKRMHITQSAVHTAYCSSVLDAAGLHCLLLRQQYGSYEHSA
jgi:hypothetical protein